MLELDVLCDSTGVALELCWNGSTNFGVAHAQIIKPRMTFSVKDPTLKR